MIVEIVPGRLAVDPLLVVGASVTERLVTVNLENGNGFESAAYEAATEAEATAVLARVVALARNYQAEHARRHTAPITGNPVLDNPPAFDPIAYPPLPNPQP